MDESRLRRVRVRVESSDLESLYTQSPGVFNGLQMLMQPALEENRSIHWNSHSEWTPESSPIIPLVTGTPSRKCQMPLCFTNPGQPLSIEDIYETETSGSINNHMSPCSKHDSHNFIQEGTNTPVPPAGEVLHSSHFSSATATTTQPQEQELQQSNPQPEVDSESIDSQETQMLLPCGQVCRTPDNTHDLVTGITEPAQMHQLCKTAPVPSSPASDLETVAGSPQSQSLLHPSSHQGSAQVRLLNGKTGQSENKRIAGVVTEITQEGKELESSQLSNLSNSGKSELEKAKAEHEKDASLMNRIESQQAKACRALSAGDPAASETVQQILDKLQPLLASLSTKCNKERVCMTGEFSRAKKSRKPVIKQKIQWLCQRQKKLVTLFTAHRSITQKLQEMKQCVIHKTAERGEKSVTVEDGTPISKTQQIQKADCSLQIKGNTTPEVFQLGINKTKSKTFTKCKNEAGPIVLKGTNLITEKPSVSQKSNSEESQSLIPSTVRKVSETPEERLLSQNTTEVEKPKAAASENHMDIIRNEDGDTNQHISGQERNTSTGVRTGLIEATNDGRACFSNDMSNTSGYRVSGAHLTNVHTKQSAKQMSVKSTKRRAERNASLKETLHTVPCPTNMNASLHPGTPRAQTYNTQTQFDQHTTVVKVSCGIYTNLLNNEPATIQMIKNLPGILTQPAERVQVENFDDPTQKFRLSDIDQVTSAVSVENMPNKGALQPKGADLSQGPCKDLVIQVVSVPRSSESVGTSNKWKANISKQNSFTAGSMNKSSSGQTTLSSKNFTGVDNITSNSDPNNDKLDETSRLSSPGVPICSQRAPPPWSSPTSTVSTVDPTAPGVKKLRGAADIAKLFRAAQQQRKKAVTRLKKPVCRKLPVSILKKSRHAAAPAGQARKSKFAQQRKPPTKKPVDKEKHTDKTHERAAQPRQILPGNMGRTAKLKPRKVVLIDDRELFPNKGFLPDNFWTAKGFAGVTIPSCLINCLGEW